MGRPLLTLSAVIQLRIWATCSMVGTGTVRAFHDGAERHFARHVDWQTDLKTWRNHVPQRRIAQARDVVPFGGP
jgi:hypothetical protein